MSWNIKHALPHLMRNHWACLEPSLHSPLFIALQETSGPIKNYEKIFQGYRLAPHPAPLEPHSAIL